MVFSKQSLYGWGVCKVPMPRAASDIFTDRRRRKAGIEFPDRRQGERPLGLLVCIGTICREDVPWREVALISGLALLLLAGLAGVATLLPEETPQLEPLPVEIIVEMPKDLSAVAIHEMIPTPTPVVPVATAPVPEEKPLPVQPVQKPAPKLVVKVKPIVKPKPVVKIRPEPPVKRVENVPGKMIAERVVELPKQEILITPPKIAKKSYRQPKERIEKAPQKDLRLDRPREEKLLSAKAPVAINYADPVPQVDHLRTDNNRTLAQRDKPEISLQAAEIKKIAVRKESADVLRRDTAPKLKQKSVAIVTPAQGFSGHVDDKRPNREKVPTSQRMVSVAPRTDSPSIAVEPSSRRTYEVKQGSADQLRATDSPSSFAAQKDIELAEVNRSTPRYDQVGNSTGDALPAGDQVFQVDSAERNTVETAVSLGQTRTDERSTSSVTITGSVPELDGRDLITIDSSLFRSLQQMKMNACLNPKEEGRLRTQLAVLLQQEGRCSDGQVAFDVKYPQDGYSIHVKMYNPAGVPVADRCVALSRAVNCFNNAK